MHENEKRNNILHNFPGVISLLCIIFFFNNLFSSVLYPKFVLYFRSDDFYWLVKLGYYILNNRDIPVNNILGGHFNELSNISWICYQWLFTLIIAIFHKFLGMHGLIFFCSSLLTGTFALLGYTLYKRGYKGFPEIFLGMLASGIYLRLFADVRPFVITLFLASLLGLLIIYSKNYRVRWIYLPLLFIFWANMHLAFIFGIGWLLVEMLFLAKEEKSFKPLISWLICFVSTGLNPYGFYLYKYLFLLGQSPYMNSHITELQPIKFSSSLFMFVWIGIGIFVLLYTFNSKNIRPAERIMWLVSLILPFVSLRHILFLILFIPTFYTEAIRKYLSRNPDYTSKWSNYKYNLDRIMLWIPVVIVIGFIMSYYKLFPIATLPKYLSNGFIEFIKDNPAKAPVLTYGEIGSELLYFTEAKPYLDTRFDMYGDNYVAKYNELITDKNNLVNSLRNNKIKYILYPANIERGLINTLNKNHWQETFHDEKVIFLERKN